MQAEGTLGVSPHRSYRRLVSLDPKGIWITVALLAALELLIVANVETLARFSAEVTRHLTPDIGAPLRFGQDTYLGADVPWVVMRLRPMTYQAVWMWFAGSMVGSYVLFHARRLVPPVRLLGSFILAFIAASAFYMLFVGHLGYEGEAFSILYVRTSVIVWILVPLVVGGLALLMPFSSLERLALAALCFGCIFILSSIRYAVFIWLLMKMGPVLMPSLYLFCGPLLDFIYLMSLYALFLVPLGRRLDRDRSRWSWL